MVNNATYYFFRRRFPQRGGGEAGAGAGRNRDRERCVQYQQHQPIHQSYHVDDVSLFYGQFVLVGTPKWKAKSVDTIFFKFSFVKPKFFHTELFTLFCTVNLVSQKRTTSCFVNKHILLILLLLFVKMFIFMFVIIITESNQSS